MKIEEYLSEGKSREWGWGFAERHMPAVKKAVGSLRAECFMDVQTAGRQQDLKEATDLVVVSVPEIGKLGVRVRSKEYGMNRRTGELSDSCDLSIRVETRHFHWATPVKPDEGTEIHKLRRGFCSRYFYGFSHDNKGELAAWWLLDVDKMREQGMFEWEQYTHPAGECPQGCVYCVEKELCPVCTPSWLQINPNGDSTAAAYLKLKYLEEQGCVLEKWQRSANGEASVPKASDTTVSERWLKIMG